MCETGEQGDFGCGLCQQSLGLVYMTSPRIISARANELPFTNVASAASTGRSCHSIDMIG